MSKYYVLVVLMVILVISTLHMYGLREAKPAEEKVYPTNEPVRVATSVKVKYLQYNLFKTKDSLFHFSYPDEWIVYDTTSDEQKKQTDVIQAWNLKDKTEKWTIKADFKERKASNSLERLTKGVCTGKEKPCERKVINSITYSKTEDLSLEGSYVATYEGLNGSRIMNITVTIKRDNQNENMDEWNRIEQSFRFFK